MSLSKSDLPDHLSLEAGSCHPSVFIADTAQLIGQVDVGEHSSVWYQSVLRADINRIVVGQRSNIQDGCVLHLENDLPCIVGDDVTVGHRAVLHACEVKDAALIGMGAIVLNGAVIGSGAVIAAGAVVKEHCVVPENTMWAGVPAKQIKVLDSSIQDEHRKWALKYVALAQLHSRR
ncbi:MAG: gamma carbonic anhydrase family protein [bacterium]